MGYNDLRLLLRQWFWILAAWFALALFDSTKTVGVMRAEGMHHNWAVLFVIEALTWLPWAISTAFVLRLGRALPLRGAGLRPWLAHIGTALCIGLAWAAWTTLLVLEFHPFGPPDTPAFLQHFLDNFYDNLPSTTVLYAFIVTIQYVLDSRERLAAERTQVAELSAQLAQTQLSVLRHQIEPHFLFNTLNAIAGLVRQGRGESAADMIASLSDFLRRTLSSSDVQEVPLSDEIEFVRRYLAIQKARFTERLHVEIDVPQELHGARVPNLILQPLVENAVKHGIAKQKRGGTIRITGCASEQWLVLTVSNDGPGLSQPRTSGDGGIGVSNVRSRLRSLYGLDSTFDMRETESGVEASIEIPLHRATDLSGATA